MIYISWVLFMMFHLTFEANYMFTIVTAIFICTANLGYKIEQLINKGEK